MNAHLLAAVLALSPLTFAHGQETPPPSPPSTQPSAEQQAPRKKSPPPEYTPPPRGTPGGRTGGGSRTQKQLPAVLPLAPKDHAGVTLSPSPVLYWFTSAPTDVRCEFTLTKLGADDPLKADIPLDASKPGLHAVSLKDLGVELEPGVTYMWSVSLIPNPNDRAKDPIASAHIVRRTPAEVPLPPAGDPATDPAADPADRPAQLAKAGLWYDLLESLLAGPAATPPTPDAAEALKSVLKSADLPEPAAAVKSN